MIEITPGWRFYTADFSLNAKNPNFVGHVSLIRDNANLQAFHKLPEEERENTTILANGRGFTIEEAIDAANERAREIGNIIKDYF
ncbi:hypothetical protein [Burkholderia phage BCSR52]|jgi:hypothetical protein|uniref:Uncharacterized protein n=1 Tax=Burkholderia phage BCSR52 TaxID=2805748 RepID=A0A889IQD1_9CAUD|nr:hypothetical protein [Burkholderia phage BCSR52]DAP64294.1 MAG TPA: hypothetical protein [Caudoviricetes sp.]